MKNRTEEIIQDRQEEFVAVFGEARVVRVNGKIHLRGGSMADRSEALEWLAMFLPGEVACVER